jgi:SIR2-like domain
MPQWNIRWREGTIFKSEKLERDGVIAAVRDALDLGATSINVAKENPPVPPGHPPYGIIYRAFEEGNVVPFLGAGASLLARPSPTETWTVTSDFPPSGLELSRFLAQQAGMVESEDDEDLARVASYYVEVSDDDESLKKELRRIFSRAAEPGKVHKLLADLPGQMLVVTTNYDTLTEQAFLNAGKPHDVVVHATDPRNRGSVLVKKYGHDFCEEVKTKELGLRVDPKSRTVIYKMHGSVDAITEWNSLVITEEDYVDFLSRMNSSPPAIPPVFTEHFSSRSFLFLGYGLRDWNLRVVLKNLSRVLPAKTSAETRPAIDFGDASESDKWAPPPRRGKKHWAIQFDPTSVEQTLWDARDVRIFNADLGDFEAGLRGVFPKVAP